VDSEYNIKIWYSQIPCLTFSINMILYCEGWKSRLHIRLLRWFWKRRCLCLWVVG